MEVLAKTMETITYVYVKEIISIQIVKNVKMTFTFVFLRRSYYTINNVL